MVANTIRACSGGESSSLKMRAARMLLGILGSALVCTLPLFGQQQSNGGPQVEVRLELVYTRDTQDDTQSLDVTRRRKDRSGGCQGDRWWSLADAYTPAGLAVMHDPMQDAFVEDLWPPPYPPLDFFDSLFLKDRRVQPTQWYARGVVVGSLGYCPPEASDPSDCYSYQGMLWILPPDPDECPRNSSVRENFVMFWDKFSSGSDDRRRCEVFNKTVHELGHVLNLHHAEIYDDPVDTLGEFRKKGKCVKHLKRHRETWNSDHVMPGCGGHAWCPPDPPDEEEQHWLDLHGQSYEQCEALPERLSDPQKNRVELTVEPEIEPEKRDFYFPGEPIHVKVSLKIAKGRIRLRNRPERILDPNLGFLTFFVREKESETFRYRPVPSPVYADPGYDDVAQRRQRFVADRTSAIAKSGIGVWYTLPVELNEKPFYLRAAFAGFEKCKKLVVLSEPVEVKVHNDANRLELWDARAFKLFTDPQSRRLLFLLGGDHLEHGIKNMETVASEYRDTIYAVYANLVLGVRLARPFYGLNVKGKPVLREAQPDKARPYLEMAQARAELLTPFYRTVLTRTLEGLDKRYIVMPPAQLMVLPGPQGPGR